MMFKDNLENTMDAIDQKLKDLDQLKSALLEARKACSQAWFLYNRFTENESSDGEYINTLRETQDKLELYSDTSNL